jgi:hypothetical protein
VLGLDSMRGIVADSKAYCKRTLGLCLEQRVGLITLVSRRCGVRQNWRRGASNTVRCPYCSKNLAVHARSLRDAGMGKVSSARWKWNMRTDDSRWQRSACSSCPPANWPSTRPAPTPLRKPKRPSASQSTSSVWKPDGVSMRPSPTMQAVVRDGGAASRVSGALMRSTIVWKRSPSRKSGRDKAVHRRPRPPRSKSAIVWYQGVAMGQNSLPWTTPP